MIPLLLFSGAFFPVSNLPSVLAWMARLTPSWHGVELCRGLSTGDLTLANAALHVAYSLAFVVFGYFGARAGFKKALAS